MKEPLDHEEKEKNEPTIKAIVAFIGLVCGIIGLFFLVYERYFGEVDAISVLIGAGGLCSIVSFLIPD